MASSDAPDNTALRSRAVLSDPAARAFFAEYKQRAAAGLVHPAATRPSVGAEPQRPILSYAGGSGPYAAAAPQAAHAWGPAQHGLPPAPQAQQHGAAAPLAGPPLAASLQQVGGPGGGALPWRQPPSAGQANAGCSSAAAGAAAATSVAASGPSPSAAELVQQLLACLHPGRVVTDHPHIVLRAKAVLLMEMSAAWDEYERDEYERIRSSSGGVQGSSEQEVRKQLLLVGRTPTQLDAVYARLFPPHPPGRMSYECQTAMYEAVGGAEAVVRGLRFRSDGRGADTVLMPTVRWATVYRCGALTTLRQALQPLEDTVRRRCGSANGQGPASAEDGQQAVRGGGSGAGPSGTASTAPDGALSSGALNSVARRVTGHKRMTPGLSEADGSGAGPRIHALGPTQLAGQKRRSAEPPEEAKAARPPAPTHLIHPPPRWELLVPIRQYLSMALAPQLRAAAPPLPLSEAVAGIRRMAKVPLTPELLRSFGFETVEALLAGALSETVQVCTEPGGGTVLLPAAMYAAAFGSVRPYTGLHGTAAPGRPGAEVAPGRPAPQPQPQRQRQQRQHHHHHHAAATAPLHAPLTEHVLLQPGHSQRANGEVPGPPNAAQPVAEAAPTTAAAAAASCGTAPAASAPAPPVAAPAAPDAPSRTSSCGSAGGAGRSAGLDRSSAARTATLPAHLRPKPRAASPPPPSRAHSQPTGEVRVAQAKQVEAQQQDQRAQQRPLVHVVQGQQEGHQPEGQQQEGQRQEGQQQEGQQQEGQRQEQEQQERLGQGWAMSGCSGGDYPARPTLPAAVDGPMTSQASGASAAGAPAPTQHSDPVSGAPVPLARSWELAGGHTVRLDEWDEATAAAMGGAGCGGARGATRWQATVYNGCEALVTCWGLTREEALAWAAARSVMLECSTEM